MFYETKINLDIPKINATYMVFKRSSENGLENSNIIENIEDILLQKNDIVLNIKTEIEFKVNEKILIVQRYIHNELNIPYKDVINVEIVYIEKKLDDTETMLAHRYPNKEQESIDFQATILDTFIDCELKKENINNNDIKMYILVEIDEQKSISETISRYLFIENIDTEQTEFNFLDIDNQSLLFNNIESKVQQFPNELDTIYDSIYDNNSSELLNPYNFLDMENYIILSPSNIHSSIENNTSFNINYEQKIQELETQRESELNEIRTYFLNNREILDDIYDESSLDLLGNIINLLQYVNNIDDYDSIEFKNLMEPVRVTISENNINTFLTSFKYNDEIDNIYIKIKEQDQCTICLSTYEKDEDVSYLKTCNHLFHTICINKWLLEFNHKCPMCRKSADPLK